MPQQRLNPKNALVVTMGVVDSDLARIRDQRGRFSRMTDAAREYTETQIGFVAVEYTAMLREEFIKGTDQYGQSHNKTGNALRSLRVEVAGLEATIKMGGGAVFVRYGWSRPEQFGYRSWIDITGQRVYTMHINPTVYKGDDFVGRAAERTDLRGPLERVAYGTFSEVTGVALNARDFQYGGGQRFQPLHVTGLPTPNMIRQVP